MNVNHLSDKSDLSQLARGLSAFRERYALSFRQLSDIAGNTETGLSPSTLVRLCRGSLNSSHTARVMPVLLERLASFLLSRGKTEPEIAHELNSITTGKDFYNMQIARVTLPLEVQDYFGLNRDPFTPTPRDEAEVFSTRETNALLNRLEDAANYQGFVAVIGAIGSGKTLLKQRLVERAKASGKLHLLFPEFFEMRRVTSGAITGHIIESFDQKPRRSLVAARDQLKQLLASLTEQGARICLVFDECHHLNDDTLTALKNFVELGSGGYTRYLGVILLGQPIFKTSRLQDPRFREIAERLEVFEMPSLKKSAWDYVTFKTRLAGVEADKIFEKKAVEMLASQTATPLALGNLCNAALIKAHSLGEPRVLASFIESPQEEPRARQLRRAS